MDELALELTLELIPESAGGRFRKMAETIGVENFYKLCCVLGGTTMYIPKAESITRPVLHERIKSEFTGRNHMELAVKYGVTYRWISELCSKKKPIGQLSVFDDAGARQ